MRSKADCLLLRRPDGTRRIVRLDRPYVMSTGEVRVGGCNCPKPGHPAVVRLDKTVEDRAQEVNSLVKELDTAIGKGFGDWIKVFVSPISKLRAQGPCSSCEARRVITNAYANLKGKHGQVEALRIIGELWQLSFSRKEKEVLERLKRYLELGSD